MEFNIEKPKNFSFRECLFFLDRDYDESLYVVDETAVTRAINLNGHLMLFKVSEKGGNLVITILNKSAGEIDALKKYVASWFDLQTDLEPYYQLLRKDPDLAFLVDRFHGLRIIGIEDLFEALCWSILGQQINLKFAYRLKRRLVEHFGTTLQHNNTPYLLFPTPDRIASLSVDQLKPLQISTRKSEYIIGVAQLMAEGKLSKKDLLALIEPEAMIEELIKIRGIGQWTANYVGMKCLKLPNSIPHGDVGLYHALHQIKGFDKRPEKATIEAFFQPFDQWKAYLTHYLWRSLYKSLI